MSEKDCSTLSSLRATNSALKSLQNENMDALHQLEAISTQPDFKYDVYQSTRCDMLKSSLHDLKDGLEQSELLLLFSECIETLEAENTCLRLALRQQREELSWIREELKMSKALIDTRDSEIAQMSTALAELRFQNELASVGSEVQADKVDDVLHMLRAPKRSSSPRDKSLILENMTQSAMSHGQYNLSVRSNGLARSSMASRPSTSEVLSVSGSMMGSADDSSFTPSKFRTLQRLVAHYTMERQFDVAANLCQNAIENAERSLGTRQSADVAVPLNMLAFVYRDQGKPDEAAKVLTEVLQIRENTLSPEHPMVATALNNLSVLYAKTGRFQEAEPLCRRALQVKRAALGADHPDVAKQLNNLALLCQSLDDIPSMEDCFRRSLEIYQKRFPERSAISLKAMNNLASAYLKSEKYAQAEDLLHRILQTSAGEQLWRRAEAICQTPADATAPFDLADWAAVARLDLPIAQSAIRNLSVVYQRRGDEKVAHLLQRWSKVSSVKPNKIYVNGSCAAKPPPPRPSNSKSIGTAERGCS